VQLLLIRHANAEDAEGFADSGDHDTDRPLTEAGRKRMRKGANRLRSQVQTIDVLACSSLLCARETAEIISRAFSDTPIVERADLAPDSNRMDSMLDWLKQCDFNETVALVGHAPHLSILAGILLAASPRPLLILKKGGVALIQFDKMTEPGAGVLRWVLTSAQLRSLKD
jgi:phosphohistidine phosphatase